MPDTIGKMPDGCAATNDKQEENDNASPLLPARELLADWYRLWMALIHGMRVATPNDPKLSDGGPEAGDVSTAVLGEGAGCAGASWRAAQPVTEPVGPKPPPLTETDMPAVRCSAWLGDTGTATN